MRVRLHFLLGDDLQLFRHDALLRQAITITEFRTLNRCLDNAIARAQRDDHPAAPPLALAR